MIPTSAVILALDCIAALGLIVIAFLLFRMVADCCRQRDDRLYPVMSMSYDPTSLSARIFVEPRHSVDLPTAPREHDSDAALRQRCAVQIDHHFQS